MGIAVGYIYTLKVISALVEDGRPVFSRPNCTAADQVKSLTIVMRECCNREVSVQECCDIQDKSRKSNYHYLT